MDSTVTLVAVVAAGAGVGYVIWKRSQKPPPEKSECQKLCDLIPDVNGSKQECLAACLVAGLLAPVLDAINPFYDSTAQITGEVKRRQDINDGLNGKTIVQTVQSGVGFGLILSSPTALYENGCEPYAYSPGWTKCKAGTLDMYASAIDAASGKNRGITEADLLCKAPGYTPQDYASTRSRKIIKDNFMTGGAGDPQTLGPWDEQKHTPGQGPPGEPNYTKTGNYYWFVRGVAVSAPPGSAPRAVVAQMQSRPQAEIAAMTDELARQPTLTTINLSDTRTNYDCASAPGSGFTWDPSIRGWRRMRGFEVQNLGPCDGTGTGGGGGGIGTRASAINGYVPRVIEGI